MMDRPFVFAIHGPLYLAAALLCAAGVAGVAGVAGCHGEVVPVSGRVTLEGKPLANAVVTFQPIGKGRAAETTTTGSAGKTDSDGRFVLRLVSPERSGAAVGDHIVTISTSPGASDTAPTNEDSLPISWRDGSRQFRVPSGGTRTANFDIKAEPSAKVDKAESISGGKKRGG